MPAGFHAFSCHFKLMAKKTLSPEQTELQQRFCRLLHGINTVRCDIIDLIIAIEAGQSSMISALDAAPPPAPAPLFDPLKTFGKYE